MPTYEYVCPKCGHEFEQFQPMSDAPLKRCPKCKKLGLKRLVGAGAGLIFKGTGFYITDYKKTSAPASEGGESRSSGGDPKPAAGDSKASGGESKGGDTAKASAESKPAPAAKPAAPPKATKSAKKR
jgi:putative FmdB family regulatory protein